MMLNLTDYYFFHSKQPFEANLCHERHQSAEYLQDWPSVVNREKKIFFSQIHLLKVISLYLFFYFA